MLAYKSRIFLALKKYIFTNKSAFFSVLKEDFLTF